MVRPCCIIKNKIIILKKFTKYFVYPPYRLITWLFLLRLFQKNAGKFSEISVATFCLISKNTEIYYNGYTGKKI